MTAPSAQFVRQLATHSPSSTMEPPAPLTTQTATTDAATTFINTHTAFEGHIPLLEECPICLDNYSTEPCVRIIGIEGCTHLVGLSCLQEILRDHPEKEKRCPLCRAMWIAASGTPARRTVRRVSMPRRMTGTFSGLNGFGENIAGQAGAGIEGQSANTTANGNMPTGNLPGFVPLIARNQRNTTMQNPILLDSDSDSDSDLGSYEAQLENFEQLTRDIENIRTRARNTQLSRSHRRREPNSRQRSNIIIANQTTNASTDSPSAAAGGNPSSGAGAFNFLNRNLHRFRPTTNDSMTATHSRNRPRASNSPLPQQDQEQSVVMMQFGPYSSHTASPNPAPTIMDVDQVIEEPHIQAQSARDTMRTRELDQRGTCLDDRETRLNQRVNALLQRELALRDREHRARQLVNVVTAQRDEMQNLLRRQMEDLERVMQ
ncbi:uncharacterized protein K460DRAFT_364894 [Cucurbitaria berberidis CBS 394.84]|uniref:RING-type domain-containing protein n=1 Tax=Cucurbitaria berberidis CBS 394.84 TaxID=1168544 RepID=A0A9P4GM78_9PLEO|nr:uncharacterized protein K460DRAFT_364894 [Cucurbitaria berberidis CBS 394.84]KAF1848968.1 hypothetical protein K460DRAFT_364894 [Cucurbitaria berberidis CBS 394.84]